MESALQNSNKKKDILELGLSQIEIVVAIVLLAAAALLTGCTNAYPTIKQIAAPAITSFTASPETITAGTSTTLSWATTGATSVSVSPGTIASVAASGSMSLSPTATTTYTLTATNSVGHGDGDSDGDGERADPAHNQLRLRRIRQA